jgi:hypothetical protein
MQNDEIDDRRETLRPDPERRVNVRRRCVLTGYVFFLNDEHILPVRVSNLSETGAKLNLSGLRPIPDSFTIAIPQRLLAFDAQVTWKKLPDLGILFVGLPSPEMSLRMDAALAKLR